MKEPSERNYLHRMNDPIPAGHVLVHNHDEHEKETEPGERGFRAWTQPLDTPHTLVPCDCGWSGRPHYRVKIPALFNY
jgi:hypothetical protein